MAKSVIWRGLTFDVLKPGGPHLKPAAVALYLGVTSASEKKQTFVLMADARTIRIQSDI